MNDDFWEELRIREPQAYAELMNSLPDVRDGLNRQQRALLVTMNRLGMNSESKTMSTAYVSLNTPFITTHPYEPEIRMHLREVRFDSENGDSSPDVEVYDTPDLFDL